MDEIKSRIKRQRLSTVSGPLQMLRPIKMLLPILGPLGAILAFQEFGVWGMIVVAWAALILFFKIK
jgi:hypothetical protein